jgi:hypothetical protein
MNATIDWTKILIRCSCIGKIMANGKGTVFTEKQAELLAELQKKDSRTVKQEETVRELIAKRDALPTLGDTAISYLKEVYVWEKYGKESVGGAERSKYVIKGKAVEEESIIMLSRIDEIPYEKNEERFKNEYLTGEPDIIVREAEVPKKIIDIKSSYDFASLLSNDDSPLNPLYYAQVQGYMALTGAAEAEVAYALVNTPPEIIEGEKRRIFYAMNPVTEESPDYKKAVNRMENNFTFDEVPIRERLLRFPVPRDENYIQKVYERIEMCREWLRKYDEKRESTIYNLEVGEK